MCCFGIQDWQVCSEIVISGPRAQKPKRLLLFVFANRSVFKCSLFCLSIFMQTVKISITKQKRPHPAPQGSNDKSKSQLASPHETKSHMTVPNAQIAERQAPTNHGNH